MEPINNENPAPNIEKPTPFIGMFNKEANTWISNDYCSD